MVEKQDMAAGCQKPGKVRIGKHIQAELRRQQRTVTWFSEKLHCDRRNIYHIFQRDSIDTHLLFMISKTLGVDFFSIYSRALQENLNSPEQ